MNDNTPVFSASIYSKRILVKDAKVGDVVLTLLATDKDIGNNSLITYRSVAYTSKQTHRKRDKLCIVHNSFEVQKCVSGQNKLKKVELIFLLQLHLELYW